MSPSIIFCSLSLERGHMTPSAALRSSTGARCCSPFPNHPDCLEWCSFREGPRMNENLCSESQGKKIRGNI